MEALAYTWFNRLVAIRYMELHGYFEHGYRVLEPPRRQADAGNPRTGRARRTARPERERVIELKLDGKKEAELYRMLLVAQCNALHSAMPFLFERIGDETELVLPDNLLHSDSIVRKLVGEIDEEDWQEVEIIGWLYQFYISERKDRSSARWSPPTTSRRPPSCSRRSGSSATSSRTRWGGSGWRPIRSRRCGADEVLHRARRADAEVQAQLRAITPTSLNPEELTFLDPACGSGHILVEAYDLFKAIYQERGYRPGTSPG